jgi:thiamine-monophosphate kinase
MNPFTDRPKLSVGALGEGRLIGRIRQWLGEASPPSPAGIGDDCAVLAPSGRRRILVTTDPILYGRHFDDSVGPAAAAGKLLKRNLSDIAAMGGVPRSAVVSLSLPRSVSIDWIRRFYQSLARCAKIHQMTIAGGDIAESAELGAFLTLLGEDSGTRVLTRDGARIGDWIYATGELGGSILGKHHRFTPRLDEGRWLASQPAVRCLMDISDGLAKDLPAITPRGAEPELIPAAVPISKAAHILARRDGRPALEHALCDGEDFELLFALEADTDCEAFAASWKNRFKTPLARLGRFVRTGTATAGAVPLSRYHGYEHLAGT